MTQRTEVILRHLNSIVSGDESKTDGLLSAALSGSNNAGGSGGSSGNDYPLNRTPWTNWAQCRSCVPRYYHEPQSLTELRKILQHAHRHRLTVRVIGRGHSCGSITMLTDGHMVSLNKHFRRILEVHPDLRVIKAEAGVLLADLNKEMDKHGLAFPVLGSISEQTLGGVLATGTHGSGIEHGILSSCVTELELMLADGTVVCCNQNEHRDLFRCALVNVGCIGVILTVTLQVDKAFHLWSVRKVDRWSPFMQQLAAGVSSGKGGYRSSEFFKFIWMPHTDTIVSWDQDKTTPYLPTGSIRTTKLNLFAMLTKYVRDDLFGHRLLELLLYLTHWFPRWVPYINQFYSWLLFLSTKNNKAETEQRDVSWKVFNIDCLFHQYVSEWSIPAELCVPAMQQLRKLIDEKKFMAQFPIEVRFVKADNIPLSPAYGRDSCYIGIISYRPYETDLPYREFFHEFQQLMMSMQGRPHWAKEYHIDTEDTWRAMYPEWDLWKRTRRMADPEGVFLNEHARKEMFLP